MKINSTVPHELTALGYGVFLATSAIAATLGSGHVISGAAALSIAGAGFLFFALGPPAIYVLREKLKHQRETSEKETQKPQIIKLQNVVTGKLSSNFNGADDPNL